MSIFWFVFLGAAATLVSRASEKIFTANYRDDPVYKKNVRTLIERNRKFEETKE